MTAHRINRPLQRVGPRRGAVGGRIEEIELGPRLDQSVHRHRHRPHRDAPGHGQGERAAGPVPQLAIERLRRQRQGARGAAVVGVFDVHQDPAGGEPAPAEPPPQRFGEPAQQGVQDVLVVGVGGERVREAVFRPDLGGEHRPRVDAPAPGAKQPPPRAEDGAELALGDSGHLADPLELIFVEPEEDVLGDLGEQLHRMGRQERGFGSIRNEQGPPVSRPSRHAAAPPSGVQPSDPRGRFRHQLVDRGADGERQPEPGGRLAPDPLRHVHHRAEEPLRAGEIEKGVAVAARLDDRGIDPEDFVQRAGGAGIEPGIGREEHQIGAELPRLPHRHAADDARRPGLGRERQHRGAIGPGGRDRQGPAPQRRGHQPLDGGDEGGRIDEEHRTDHPRFPSSPNASCNAASLRASARS